MLSKRIIVCLDVREGKTTKGIKFKGNIDIGDPVEMARRYYEAGADEIVFYDITASHEKRDIMIDVVTRVTETIFIPFSVGGGIRTVQDMKKVLLAGAEKAEKLGAGEICLNSIDADGAKKGYEMTLTRMISEHVSIPVIASGGAGSPQHICDVLTEGKADAGLIASIVHYGTYSIKQIKDFLGERNVPVRTVW